jgi:ABC-2 type transport system ATP-binding protein
MRPATKEFSMIATLPQTTPGAVPISGYPAPVACLQGVTKIYGSVKALFNIDLAVQPGELLALLGPNGAGKTTAVRLLLGLAKPTRGSARVFGADPVDSYVRMRIGAMLQVAKVPETLRVSEHIRLFSSYYPNPLPLPEVLATAGLQDIQNRAFGDLSGGQKQRVLFALAICGDPDLLFLDEPTVGLDVEARRLLWKQIRNLIARGKTVLLTTHYLQEADELADRVVVIDQGSIVAQGTPSEIKARTGGRRIRCVTELSLDSIRRMPGVIDTWRDREAVEIRAAKAEPALRELLKDPTISDIEVSSGGLEEAFLALTHSSHHEKQA